MAAEAPLIAVVDDDIDFQDWSRCVLERAGYRVVCWSNPELAFDQIVASAPALVISDVMMGALDSGFSLARRIKEDPRCGALPVIIVTAAASQHGFDFVPRSPEDLAAMGADAFFSKPVDPAALLAKVRALVS